MLTSWLRTSSVGGVSTLRGSPSYTRYSQTCGSLSRRNVPPHFSGLPTVVLWSTGSARDDYHHSGFCATGTTSCSCSNGMAVVTQSHIGHCMMAPIHRFTTTLRGRYPSRRGPPSKAQEFCPPRRRQCRSGPRILNPCDRTEESIISSVVQAQNLKST